MNMNVSARVALLTCLRNPAEWNKTMLSSFLTFVVGDNDRLTLHVSWAADSWERSDGTYALAPNPYIYVHAWSTTLIDTSTNESFSLLSNDMDPHGLYIGTITLAPSETIPANFNDRFMRFAYDRFRVAHVCPDTVPGEINADFAYSIIHRHLFGNHCMRTINGTM